MNDARVVKADIPAINGYIHVIDKVRFKSCNISLFFLFIFMVLSDNFKTFHMVSCIKISLPFFKFQVLEPYPVSVDQPSLEEFFMAHPEFSMFSASLKVIFQKSTLS